MACAICIDVAISAAMCAMVKPGGKGSSASAVGVGDGDGSATVGVEDGFGVYV